jgi:hypothetical protein
LWNRPTATVTAAITATVTAAANAAVTAAAQRDDQYSRDFFAITRKHRRLDGH